MIDFSSLRQSTKAAVIAAPLIVGYTTLPSAHSWNACVDGVISFCRIAHGYTPAGDACVASGTSQCSGHTHPGGTIPPPPDPNITADLGHQLDDNPELMKLRVLKKPSPVKKTPRFKHRGTQ